MMTIIFILFICATYWHYVYESIIAPNLRMKLRYQFFKLRDELRFLKVTKSNELSNQLYSQVEDTLNFSIQHLSLLSLTNIRIILNKYQSDEKFKAETDTKMNLISNSKLDEIKKIDLDIVKLYVKALLINSGGWAIYTIPLMIIFATILFVSIKIKEWFLNLFRKFSYSLSAKLVSNSGDYALEELSF